MAVKIPIPILDKGCFGFIDLRTCCKLQGYLTLVVSFVGIIMNGVALETIAHVEKRTERIVKANEMGADDPIEEEAMETLQEVGTAVRAILILNMILYIIASTFAILLLRGIYTSNRKMIEVYMYVGASVWILHLVLSIAMFCIELDGVYLVTHIVSLTVAGYFLLHVYSLYMSMEYEDPGAAYAMQGMQPGMQQGMQQGMQGQVHEGMRLDEGSIEDGVK